MPIVTAMCTSYRQELFEALHNHTLGGHQFNMALYLDTATLGADTTAYTASNEASGAGYSAGGLALVNVAPTSAGTSAYTQFENAVWPNSTITARGCLIHNATSSSRAVSVHDFGQNYASIADSFSVLMPTFDGITALLRLV